MQSSVPFGITLTCVGPKTVCVAIKKNNKMCAGGKLLGITMTDLHEFNGKFVGTSHGCFSGWSCVEEDFFFELSIFIGIFHQLCIEIKFNYLISPNTVENL